MTKAILGLFFLSGIANAATYECGQLRLSATRGSKVLQIRGLDGAGDKAVRGTQTRYNPSEKNAGSTRFDISSICISSGDVYAILDKDLSTGKMSGILTIQSTCDADGGAPTFERHSCRAQ